MRVSTLSLGRGHRVVVQPWAMRDGLRWKQERTGCDARLVPQAGAGPRSVSPGRDSCVSRTGTRSLGGFAKGKVVEERFVFDTLGQRQQLGVIPNRLSATAPIQATR